MPLPFDATAKDIGAAGPCDFLALFDGPPSGPVKLLNADLSTVTAGADLVLGIGDPVVEILHFDFQSSADIDKGRDVLVYNALIHRLYKVPVHSVLVLMRPKAAHSEVDGKVAYAPRPGRGSMSFGYEVFKLWEQPVETLLRGPVGTLPLAVLGKLPDRAELVQGLRSVIERIWERVAAEAEPGQGSRLRVSAFELLNLRVKRNEARAIIVNAIERLRDSEVGLAMQDIFREEEARKLILRLARKRLGPEDESVLARLKGIEDLERLERIQDRLVDPGLSSWQDLLDTP